MHSGEGEIPVEVSAVYEKEAKAEQFVAQAKREMIRVFPEYNVVDQQRWDAYKPEEDFGNGRILSFHKGEISPNSPCILFIVRRESRRLGGAYCVKFNNNPLAIFKDHIANPSRPVYERMDTDGRNDKDWDLEDMGMAVDATKMIMEGVALTPEVLDQPTFLMKNGEAVSMRQLAKAAEEYKAERKSLTAKEKKLRPKMKEEMREKFEPQDLYKLTEIDPETVRNLVLKRLEYQAAHNVRFVMGREEFDAASIIE